MLITLLKAKLHGVRVTECRLDYDGSIELDPDYLDAAGLVGSEWVHVFNITNGERFQTYIIVGERGSRTCGINGAAARLCQVGDEVIVAATAQLTPEEARNFTPTVVLFGDGNAISRQTGSAAGGDGNT
jgi:aspartate 1-decarboxylase